MTDNQPIEVIKSNRPTSGYVLLNEALVTAINALEKQIPKKPDCIEDKMWCCPVCDNNLLHKWIKYPTKLMPKAEGLPHCMSCGQKIDWSDEKRTASGYNRSKEW